MITFYAYERWDAITWAGGEKNATWPLVIDQAVIALPHWPRDQQWWARFVPLWSTAVVRADGTVAIDVNDRRTDGARIELDSATAKHRRQALFSWLSSTLPEAFPQICGPVTRDARGRVTPMTWTTDARIERNGYSGGDDQQEQLRAIVGGASTAVQDTGD